MTPPKSNKIEYQLATSILNMLLANHLISKKEYEEIDQKNLVSFG